MARETGDVFTYPMPRRRYLGMVEFSPLRMACMAASLVVAIVAAAIFVPSLFLVVPIGLYLIAPTKDGFGCDSLLLKRQNRRFRKRGGYYYSPSVRRKEGEWESGLHLVRYQLPRRKDYFAVIRNQRAGVEIVYVLIRGWKGSVADDPADRIRKDIDLNEVIVEITKQLVDHATLFTVRRSADVTGAYTSLDAYGSDDPDLRRDIEEAIELVASQSQDVTYVLAMRCGIAANPDKLLQSGNWSKVPAVLAAQRALELLAAVNVAAEVPSESELQTLLRSIFDPADETHAAYYAADRAAGGEYVESDVRNLMGPLSVQLPAIPRSAQGSADWLRFNGSYHTIAVTGRFKKRKVPPGFFDEIFNGLSDWCIVSVDIDVVPKEKATFLAKQRRQWVIGRHANQLEKGQLPTQRDMLEFEESIRRYDEIDLADSDMAYWSFMVVLSDASPEALKAVFETVRGAALRYGLALERVDGDAVQLKCFHAAIGLL